MIISPILLRFWDLNIMNTNPRPTSGMDSIEMSAVNPSRDMSQEVTVVPILAPIITPTAWVRLSRPALTKLTIITVVALEDWMMAVMRVPVRTRVKELAVMAERMERRRLPATFWRPSLISVMP